MIPELKEAARLMGYRPMPSEGQPENDAWVWGKPSGFSLLVICQSEIHGIEWMQWFYNEVDSKPILWDREVFEEKRSPWYDQPTCAVFLNWVKECENYHQKCPHAGNSRGSFEFLTLTQSLGGVP